MKIAFWVYSVESPHLGDSNENTQYKIIVWKVEKKPLTYRHLLIDCANWRHD